MAISELTVYIPRCDDCGEDLVGDGSRNDRFWSRDEARRVAGEQGWRTVPVVSGTESLAARELLCPSCLADARQDDPHLDERMP